MMNFPRDHRIRRPAGSSQTTIVVFTAVGLVSAALFFIFTLPKLKEREKEKAAAAEQARAEAAARAEPAPTPRAATVKDPESSVRGMVLDLQTKGAAAFLDLLGPKIVTPPVLIELEQLLGPKGYGPDAKDAVFPMARDVNRETWGLRLRLRAKPEITSAIEMDFVRRDDGTWTGEALRLPPMPGKVAENPAEVGKLAPDAGAMDIATAFINAVVARDFPAARAHVDRGKVRDTTIAGLCILFEEGAFKLREEKPIIATVAREDVTWLLAHVTSELLEEESRFGLVLQRDPGKPWLITEVNLDRLLSSYAAGLAEGDIEYTPLVKNPKGGDSIVLYFAYDSDELHPRTRRQIEIVAGVLKADEGRRLKIYGHTDALGGEDYNIGLSRDRADAVRAAMIESGVPANQITIEGFGAAKPRGDNFRPDGSDNPEGRRLNRRAEILLDF
jgi:outer membrane protein OmpA-like peptidoglycan-associated protein